MNKDMCHQNLFLLPDLCVFLYKWKCVVLMLWKVSLLKRILC